MNRILAFLLLLSTLFSCTFTQEDIYINELNGTWDKNTPQKFEIEIKDIKNPKNIVFIVRNNAEYPYSNLRLFSKLYKKGDKNITIDTLNYILAKPNGEWLGSGFGDTKEILFQYKLQHTFPTEGIYIVEIQHAMRRNPLLGIEDIGIKLEPVRP